MKPTQLTPTPQSLYPVSDSLNEVINSGIGQLPIADPNQLRSLMLHYHNTLLSEVKKTCNWKPEIDGEFWSGECGAAWTLIDAGPKENNMHYCPECGGQLNVPSTQGEVK